MTYLHLYKENNRYIIDINEMRRDPFSIKTKEIKCKYENVFNDIGDFLSNNILQNRVSGDDFIMIDSNTDIYDEINMGIDAFADADMEKYETNKMETVVGYMYIAAYFIGGFGVLRFFL